MNKTYIIPDIHGDFKQLCNILYIIGVLKDKKYLVSKINDIETPSINDIQKKLKNDSL